MPGLLFGFTFVFSNKLIFKIPLPSYVAVILSVGIYYLAVLLCVSSNFHPSIVGFFGAGLLAFVFDALFGIEIPYGIAAMIAGGLGGALLTATITDEGYRLVLFFSAWQCFVGLLLSLGIKK